MGDGEINVGIGLLSTFRDFKSVNTTHILSEFAATAPEYWGISARDGHARCPPAGACRWAARSTPRSDPTWIVVGDAAGSINPFNGEGIDYAYETGRMAADLLDEALRDRRRHGPAALPRRCSTTSTASTSRWPGSSPRSSASPALMRELTRVGMQSRTLMDWVLRIMANLLRADELGPAEAAYRAVAQLARVIPERPRRLIAAPARPPGRAHRRARRPPPPLRGRRRRPRPRCRRRGRDRGT